MIIFAQLGTHFDSVDNFAIWDAAKPPDYNYNTDFNNYPAISHVGTLVIAQLRNSFGDAQVPTYDYWSKRYMKTEQKGIAQFYITFTWIIWLIKFYVMIVIMLNLLISIVSETFGYILDN